MKDFLFYAALFLFFLGASVAHPQALADTLTVDITNPTHWNGKRIPATGPDSLESVTVQHGTCTLSGAFGIWEGGKTKSKPLPTQLIFDGVPNRRTCTRAYWTTRRGTRSAFSPVSIAKATP